MQPHQEATYAGKSHGARNSQQALLETFLASPVRPRYTMNFFQLDGYLRALAAAPGANEPKDWMPLVFGGEAPNYRNEDESISITNALISLYNFHNDQVLKDLCSLPCAYGYTENREKRLDLEQWARGFLQGYIVWQSIWDQFLNQNQTTGYLAAILPLTNLDEIDDILATISNVADAEYALHNGVTVEELKQMFNRLPEQVIQYGRIGHMVRNCSKDYGKVRRLHLV